MAAKLHTVERVIPPRSRLEFASPARTTLSMLDQMVFQLERMQLQAAQSSSEPSEADRADRVDRAATVTYNTASRTRVT